MVHAPSRRQRTSVRALVVATHAGPTVAVTTTATLLAVTAGVAPERVGVLALAVLAGQVSIGGATFASLLAGIDFTASRDGWYRRLSSG